MGTPLLKINHISKSFPGVKALDDISFSVEKGRVHAVMGENGAGKSTLMKCIFGLYHPDEGDIILYGNKCLFSNTRQALDNGISMIHQELQNVPSQNVMENIWIGRIPYKKVISPLRITDEDKMYKDTLALFDKLNLDIDPKKAVKDLSVSTCQLLEIARAVSYNAKLIIMDEPTSSLTDKEAAILFSIIDMLIKSGVSILYISHKIEEVMQISNEVTILRDGTLVGTYKIKDIDSDFLIRSMVGRELTNRFPQRPQNPHLGDVMLKVSHLESAVPGSFSDISFDVKRGEILGIGGLVGAQRTELMESVFGLRPVKNGTIEINGEPVTIKSSGDAIKKKMGLLTEERARTGILGKLSITDNMLVVNQRYNLPRYRKNLIFLNNTLRKSDSREYTKDLSVKTPSIDTQISSLSGGNQQKVLLGRWLMLNPDILILDEPTRGIDVGAKYEIYLIMRKLTSQGKSIIMISSEMPELMGMSDRIMVMCEGHLSGIIDGKTATDEEIMKLASSY
ncbi:MAG: sugar ABC transporter ATP-binding protein [Spirochaetales bacterium]|nr:sugar ABC transporter ATP-binding protein [Spirochaetales bacterium]